MDIETGLRVVRGPDWEWGDQDGGEGCVGTVTELPEGVEDGRVRGVAVVVQWDAGNRCNYRCGLENKYDLRIYDTAQIGVKHAHIICDVCKEHGVLGIRWKCSKCYDFDLCTLCYNSGKHSLEHEFMRMEKDSGPRTRVPARLRGLKLAAKGLFTNAEVIRGHDWVWGDQDGGSGKTGQVSSVKGHGSENTRSVVEVMWRDTKKKNIYRAGHKGKVDLKCKELGSGGYFYPEHLPVLEVIGEMGTIQSVTDAGDVRVRYPGVVWTVNPDVLTKISGSDTEVRTESNSGRFKEGDVVRIIDDIAEVHTLQEDHGGWVDDIALALGQVGRIKTIFASGDCRVHVNGNTWTLNPLCMKPAPEENPPDIPDGIDEDDIAGGLDMDDIGLHLKLLSMLENPAVLVAAAAAGDPDTIRTFLSTHPKEVDAKAAGKTAIHCAAVGGHVEVMKVLLEYKPDLEVEDEDGDKPLHLAAYSDEDVIAQLLLKAGARVNSKNHKEATPLIIAAVKGHTSVLKILTQHSDINLAEQDSDGDTALHCAVLAQKNESVSVLLDAGAVPTLLNFRLFTPVHESARIGFLPALEQFIRREPDLIALKKEDGYTPLHLAAHNDHLDVVTMLIDHDGCEMDSVSNTKTTPLHAAITNGHPRIVERLVGFGCNLNLQDEDGDTPLHLAVLKDSIDPLSPETPQLRKVREGLSIAEDNPSHLRATIACFLVQEGANIYVQNNKGLTPLQICAPDIAALITSFVGKSTSKKFHNSLRAPPPPATPLVSSSLTVEMTGGKSPVSAEMESGKPSTAPVSFRNDSGLSSASASSQGACGGSQEQTCFLCEEVVDIRLEPCKHAVLCADCAQRAKKCPQCRMPVKSTSKLKKICPMCDSNEEATVTLRPCEHQFCPGCARRMKLCFDCRVEITAKEGLPPEKPEAKKSSNAPTLGNCPICLTEPKNTAFLCGHQLCWECAQKVDNCPVCRKFVTHRIQLFQ